MRLTNLNCPQCGGFLNQQQDKFYCTSCGAAFNVDYDEADVEYAKLVTEADRTRLLIEKDRTLLEKDAELRKKFMTSEMKQQFKHAAKSQGTTLLGGLILYAVMGGVMMLVMIGTFIVIGTNIAKDRKTRKEAQQEAEKARIERLTDISVKDLENDPNFIENTIGAGASYELSRRSAPVLESGGDEGDAYLVGTPEAIYSYMVKDGTDISIYNIYKCTYEYLLSGNTTDVYSCVCFEKVEADETGHFTCNYSLCKSVTDDNIDNHWEGYENDKGALNVIPESGSAQIDLPKGGEA